MKQVETILRPLQDALAVDGTSLEVLEVDGPVLRVGVDATDAECPECVVPDDTLAMIVLARLSAAGDAPQIERVEVQRRDERAMGDA